MTTWHDISTYDQDGPEGAVMLRAPDGLEFPAFLGRVDDEDGNDVWVWHASDEGRHPPCWSDGVCWGSNEDGRPSVLPTHWRRMAEEEAP